MDKQLLMDTAVLAGEIMLCSGAETYRVEDTMDHILNMDNVRSTEIFVIMTGIIATLKSKDAEAITIFKRVKSRKTNLTQIVEVNHISRLFCSEEISLEETYKELQKIGKKNYKRVAYNVATIGVVVGFAIMLGGTVGTIFATALAGLILAITQSIGKRLQMQEFIMDSISSVGVAFVPIALRALMPFEVNMDIVIISAIMPLVPGVSITNAVRDTLQGDYISGGARILEAFLKAVSIALGIGIGMMIFGELFLGRGL